ncbi:hypothetical protein [Pedobacter metabolipauper]|uniref:Uncharacterized protein n=1 Tax=Pedobacter metabolipauper TaxID=425513 RepID=A0A4R6T1K6_9SPHI|nr:hypothetical protein [Pedobacter metabolipauper]TDQ11528.1 hypothetical protein ATK78_0651 [Pedobacter metabolipauper]
MPLLQLSYNHLFTDFIEGDTSGISAISNQIFKYPYSSGAFHLLNWYVVKHITISHISATAERPYRYIGNPKKNPDLNPG